MAYDRYGNRVVEDVQSPYNRGPSFGEGLAQMGRDVMSVASSARMPTPYETGRAIRSVGDAASSAGDVISQTARGIADAPGKTYAGMKAAAQPYFDRQFAEMRNMGNDFREGLGLKRIEVDGVNQPQQQQPSGPIQAPVGVTKGGMPDKYTAGSDEIVGAAARINPSAGITPRGTQVYNYYDPDRPASMGSGQSPWQDMARQIANFSALRQMEPQGGYVGIMGDPNDAANAEKTARWRQDELLYKMQQARSPQEKEALGRLAQESMRGFNEGGLAREKMANDMGVANMRGQLDARGQDLRMQEASMGVRSRAEMAKLEGDNRLENTRLAGRIQGENQMALDEARGLRDRGLVQYKHELEANDPVKAAQARYYGAAADSQTEHAGLYKATRDAQERQSKMDPHLQLWAKMKAEGSLDPSNPGHAAIEANATRALERHFAEQQNPEMKARMERDAVLEQNPEAQMIRKAVQAGRISREEAEVRLRALANPQPGYGEVVTPSGKKGL